MEPWAIVVTVIASICGGVCCCVICFTFLSACVIKRRRDTTNSKILDAQAGFKLAAARRRENALGDDVAAISAANKQIGESPGQLGSEAAPEDDDMLGDDAEV